VSDELSGIHLTPRHFGEVHPALVQCGGGELVEVVELPHCDDRVGAVVRADDERLIVVVTDDADPHAALELRQVILELAAELGIGDVVNDAAKPRPVPHGHPAPHGAEVRVIVRAVEQVRDAVVVRHDAEQSAHGRPQGCSRV
jgi:hypothetical protein